MIKSGVIKTKRKHTQLLIIITTNIHYIPPFTVFLRTGKVKQQYKRETITIMYKKETITDVKGNELYIAY